MKTKSASKRIITLMKKIPLVSVILPVKGRYNYVSEAIRSVYGQMGVPRESIEIIVVENHDDPKLLKNKLLKKFPDIRHVLNMSIDGPGRKRNTGMNKSRGKYIAFLDSDDIWERDFLKTSIALLQDNPEIGATLCLSKPFFMSKKKMREKIIMISLHYIKDIALLLSYLANGKNLPSSAFYLPQVSHMVFNKNNIKNIQFLPEFRKSGQDWRYFAHVLESNNIRILLRRMVRFRYSGGSLTRQRNYVMNKVDNYRRLDGHLSDVNKRGLFYFLYKRYVSICKYIYT